MSFVLIPNQKYDQMRMLTLCLPILMLQISSPAQRRKFTQHVNHSCALFLKGEWWILNEVALSDLAMHNEWDQTHFIKSPNNNKQQVVLDQIRKLNYSKAMNLNIFQSPGLAADSPAVILKKPQDLHLADCAAPVEIHSPLVIQPLCSNSLMVSGWGARSYGPNVGQW